MDQDKLMSQAEDQWLDDLDDEHFEQERKELAEQEEEEQYMLYQASMFSY